MIIVHPWLCFSPRKRRVIREIELVHTRRFERRRGREAASDIRGRNDESTEHSPRCNRLEEGGRVDEESEGGGGGGGEESRAKRGRKRRGRKRRGFVEKGRYMMEI